MEDKHRMYARNIDDDDDDNGEVLYAFLFVQNELCKTHKDIIKCNVKINSRMIL